MLAAKSSLLVMFGGKSRDATGGSGSGENAKGPPHMSRLRKGGGGGWVGSRRPWLAQLEGPRQLADEIHSGEVLEEY